MATAALALQEDYWDNFELLEDDIEFIYNHLLELETPLTTEELIVTLVDDRITREKAAIEKRRTSGGDLYKPKGTYKEDQTLVFPALNWQRGKVVGVRDGHNPETGKFNVIRVELDDGDEREFAAKLKDHRLNDPPAIAQDDPSLNRENILENYNDLITGRLEEDLTTNPDFVRIAGRWFPRALLVDINMGHMNITEAVLDMNGGGPLPTSDLLEQIELETSLNPKLLEFSLDLALQEDERFDEVGPAGDVLWYLKRLEPADVQETPLYLRYDEIDYDRDVLTEQMLALELDIDDELSPISRDFSYMEVVEVCLTFPHLHSGTLPLSARVDHLFPTSYEAPRIRFQVVDGDSGEKFAAWVVRKNRYVYGLKDWYEKHGLLPGSIILVSRGENPGEVVVSTNSRRSSREWIKTVLVGSDGGVVYALLKQVVPGQVDDRMGIAIPDPDALDGVWNIKRRDQAPFEEVVVNNVRELAKLNPQSHVHASELYAAVNVVRRCPPGPIMALLASRPWFAHVGDLHYRLSEQEI